MISPVARAERDPSADNSPPRPQGQDSPNRDMPGHGEGPQEGQAPREPRTGGEGGSVNSGVHLLKCSRRLGGLNVGREGQAPQEDRHRGQAGIGSGRQATQTGQGAISTGERNSQRNRRNRGQNGD